MTSVGLKDRQYSYNNFKRLRKWIREVDFLYQIKYKLYVKNTQVCSYLAAFKMGQAPKI